eukprot:TRINITY_DN3884_c0_g1_i1.p1 TRINITY_DN3884_c0_g1~~TRINITY_DN3884_c0_g1_i1.p1  ORF type:complete len:411 (-),score=59.57 TRINITY_DN3884_c0_g1_i1:46-1278(-)
MRVAVRHGFIANIISADEGEYDRASSASLSRSASDSRLISSGGKSGENSLLFWVPNQSSTSGSQNASEARSSRKSKTFGTQRTAGARRSSASLLQEQVVVEAVDAPRNPVDSSGYPASSSNNSGQYNVGAVDAPRNPVDSSGFPASSSNNSGQYKVEQAQVPFAPSATRRPPGTFVASPALAAALPAFYERSTKYAPAEDSLWSQPNRCPPGGLFPEAVHELLTNNHAPAAEVRSRWKSAALPHGCRPDEQLPVEIGPPPGTWSCGVGRRPQAQMLQPVQSSQPPLPPPLLEQGHRWPSGTAADEPAPHMNNATLDASIPLNDEGEPTSRGSRNHPDSCSPCIFWFRGLCGKGMECDYCHIKHPGQKNKRIRPSKSTRLQLRANKALAEAGTTLTDSPTLKAADSVTLVI